MGKQHRNSGQLWTRPQRQTLTRLARQNTPTGLIAWKMGRSESAIYSQAARQGTSLKPPNRSPRG